jgi:hypothetical protein
MPRRIVLAVSLLAALAVAPIAHADGVMPTASELGYGAVSTDGPWTASNGTIRYVALPAGGKTDLAAIATRDGMVVGSQALAGVWGLPRTSYTIATSDALSHDEQTLILQRLDSPATRTSFAVVETFGLSVADRFTLRGHFAFDALSPDASRMYLIQYTSVADTSRYVVRAYDLAAHRLLPGRIADRTQKSWIMQGAPVTRTTSADGRWVYTLYENPGGTPFVHALDTVAAVAHCIGIPWATPNQNGLFNVVLAVRNRGRSLDLHWRSGRPWLAVAQGTWRISYAQAGFPWRWVGSALAGGLLLLVAAAGLLLRLRRGSRGGFLRRAPARAA